MSFVNEQNTGHRPDKGNYSNVIKQIAKDGVCPFCTEHISKYHPHPLEEHAYWRITDNAYPYEPKKHHRLIILKEHLEHLDDISDEAWMELRKIIREENKKRNIEGGAFVCRFGQTRYTGASVSHLHAHLYQSDPDNPNYNPKLGTIMRIG